MSWSADGPAGCLAAAAPVIVVHMNRFAAGRGLRMPGRALWHRRAAQLRTAEGLAAQSGHGAGLAGSGVIGPDTVPATVGSGAARRRATGFSVVVLCLLLAARLAAVMSSGHQAQVPFTVALFVLPVLYAFPGARLVLSRYRWPVLAAQGALTWVPFAVFGASWQHGIDGLLAGLVLLTVRGRGSWLLAGALLAAEVIMRMTVTGIPFVPTWFGVIWVVTFYVDDALVLFGMLRLAQIVGEIEQARSRAAELAVAGERLQAAQALQAAVGRRLTGIATMATAARRALADDAGLARAQVAAAGAEAREAVAEARAVAAGRGTAPPSGQVQPPAGGAVIGARLARAVLVSALLMFCVENVASVVDYRLGAWVTAVAVCDIVLVTTLQLSLSAKARRSSAWRMTLVVQAVLVYGFAFGFTGFSGGTMAPFLAGSVLLMVPGRRRWAGYAAVVVSSSALYAILPVSQLGPPVSSRAFSGLFFAAITAEIGLVVYGLSRLAGLASELEELRGQLSRSAALRGRLRVARDVHDLLGLGLSAIALKADLAGALIGCDDSGAAAEIGEMRRICAAVRADIGQVTQDRQRLSLAVELADARQILTSAGIQVSAEAPVAPLPRAADEVLAPVLREAVTNILRHASVTVCVLQVTAGDAAVRLRVVNDGADRPPSAVRPARPAGGHGLTNLDTRVRAAGGQLATTRADGWFEVTAQIPARGRAPASAGLTAMTRQPDPAGQHGADGMLPARPYHSG
jgi:two-component system, NarL family, sensor histidine kinase DesK